MKLIRLFAAVLAAGVLSTVPPSIAQQGDQKETPVQVGTTMLTPDQLKAALDKMRTDLEQEKGKSAYLEKKLEDGATALTAEKSKVAELEKLRKDLERETNAGEALRNCYKLSNVGLCLVAILTDHAGTQAAVFATTELGKVFPDLRSAPGQLVINQQRPNPPNTMVRSAPGPNFVQQHDGYVDTDCPAVQMPLQRAAKQPVKRQQSRVATACPLGQPQR